MESVIAQANKHTDVAQSRAFCAWANAHLRRINQPAISDLVFDLQNGVTLCHLVGSVLHSKVRGFTAAPKHNAGKMANLSLALDTVESCGVTVTCSPQDFIDMNTKPILGFIWSLIAKEQASGGGGSSEDALKEKLSALAGGAPVPNLTSAFSDGILLAKMVDKKKSGLINPAALDASRGADNVGNALHLLETHFKMPHVVDAQDIASNPDSKVMATFIPFLIEALEGTPAVGRQGDDGPRVFSRGSAVASSPASAASSGSVSPPPSRPAYISSQPSPGASQASYVAPREGGGGGGGGGPVQVRTTPLLNFSSSIISKYPGISFQGVNVDGRSAEGALPCHQCHGELGNGRAFKFFVPGAGQQYVHSRCFSCFECRRDFVQGVFYIGGGDKLLCTQHYMHEQGIVCATCSEPIVDFFVNALEKKFHESCFQCHGPCKKVFKEPKFFAGANGFPFCPECHAAAEGRVCKRCGKGVPAPVKAMDAFWHDSCFSCQKCHKVITASYVEKDGWPQHGECAKSTQHSPPPPNVPKVPKAGGYSGGGGGGYSGGAVSPGRGGSASGGSAPTTPVASSAAAPCASCNRSITQGEAVTVSGKRYHADCFKCCKCSKAIAGSFFS
jgi:hypothetical protein